MGPADSDRITRVPPYSGYCLKSKNLLVRGCHPLWPDFPDGSDSFLDLLWQSYYPMAAETAMVWANPRSLAATGGITVVFSSSGYLDVSVLRVCIPFGIPYLQYGGLPHSDIHGSMLICNSP